MTRWYCWFVMAALGFSLAPLRASGAAASAATRPADVRPRLVLLLVVDQLRADHLTRLESSFTGGFKRLMDESAWFTEAHHAHAITDTAPGHATIATGLHPRRHGIIDNRWYDREAGKEVVAAYDPDQSQLRCDGKRSSSDTGRSPRSLLASSLPDWMREADGDSLTFAIGAKDRAAVLLGGKKADAAYWLDVDSGAIISSTYYMQSLPSWVRAFQKRQLLDESFGTMWEPLPINETVARNFAVRTGGASPLVPGFPHHLGVRTSRIDHRYYREIAASPWVDVFFAQLAIEALVREGLGRDDRIDYLAVSFSALDSVGHEYGPDSPEVLDTLLRLDGTLDLLLQRVDETVGLERTLVVLTSDHGVLPLPESGSAEAKARLNALDVRCFQAAGKNLRAELGNQQWEIHDGYLDYEAISKMNLRRQDVEQRFKAQLERCTAVERVWTRTELESPSSDDRKPLDLTAASRDFQQLYRNSFQVDRSPDLVVQLHEGYLKTLDMGTDHGTPYRYDTHVPVLIRVRGGRTGKIAQPIATVDIAPTVAAVAGIAYPEALDGVDRSDLVVGR